MEISATVTREQQHETLTLNLKKHTLNIFVQFHLYLLYVNQMYTLLQSQKVLDSSQEISKNNNTFYDKNL